jgi:hypothetical protein
MLGRQTPAFGSRITGSPVGLVAPMMISLSSCICLFSWQKPPEHGLNTSRPTASETRPSSDRCLLKTSRAPTRPGNSWDLKSCKEASNETLCEYIRRFSKQSNDLPNIVDTDMVGAFLSGTTYQSLVHKLGYVKPRTIKDLLDLTTNNASGEEAVGAIFDKSKGKAHRNNDEDTSSHHSKKKSQDALIAGLLGRPTTMASRAPSQP